MAASGFSTMATAATLVDSFDNGWYESDGSHDSTNDNVILGSYLSGNYRNWFAFSTSGLSEAVTGATLVFRSGNGSWQGDATETIEVYDVTTSSASVVASSAASSAGGLATYADLGSGTFFGSVTTSGSFDVSMPEIRVTLNSDAIAAINAARTGADTNFLVGGLLASDDGGDWIFSSSSGVPAATLELTTAAVPLPAGLPLLAAGLGALAFLRRRRRA
jgi:hypothetical protein